MSVRETEPLARAELALFGAVFLLSRLLYQAAGIRFTTNTLDFYWQYLDPRLLATDLWRSVWHLHSQPPLFNLFLGAVLRLPRALWGIAFHAAFAACGLALGAVLLALAARLGAPRRLRLPAVALFVASPACILTENLLFYSYPVMAALAAAALCLHRFVATGRRAAGLACFALLAAVALTQSLFHLVLYLAVVAAGVAVAARPLRRAAVAAAALPLLLVALWYARSAVLFGTFSASSWMGMSFAKIATKFLPPEDQARFAAEDPSEAILAVEPFSRLDHYAGFVRLPRPTGFPALDEPVKANGERNLNQLAYLDLSRRYLEGTRSLVRRHPVYYVHGVVTAWLIYLRSGADSAWLGQNRDRIAGLSRWFDRLAYLQMEPFEGRLGPSHIAWSLVFLLPAAVVSGIRSARRRYCAGDFAGAATLFYMVITIAYVAIAGNSIELGENNRFRLETEPLALVLLLLFLTARLPARWTAGAAD